MKGFTPGNNAIAARGIISSFLVLTLSTNMNPVEPQNAFTDVRDGNTYTYKEINGLKWMTENLRFKTESSMNVADSSEKNVGCGEFYSVNDAFKVCPDGWRLPTQKEVKGIIKWHKKNGESITENLNILLCGRVDNGKLSKEGEQNTFWMEAPLENGNVLHWHTFDEEQELHTHNVVNAERQFPVRCVCEVN